MSYRGDIRLGETLDFKFTTRRFSTGAPFTLAGTPVISAYVGNGTTEITAGITLTVDFDSRTGLNNVRVVATSGNGFATATNVELVITTGTVDSVSVVGEVIGSFSIENRSAVMPTTAARTLDVSAGGEAGVDWANVGSPTTTLNLSGTTVAAVTATVSSDVVSISGDTAAADNAESYFDGTGYGEVLQRTTIATLASQTSFTLTAGSADDDAYNGCVAVVQDVSTAAQKAVGVILDYTGSSKTVTLLADPAVFTMATTDIIAILACRALKPTVPLRTLDVSAGGEAGLDWANIGSPTTTVSLSGTTVATVTTTTTATNVTTVNGLAANVITATSIASDAFTAAKFAADCITATKIADGAIDAATFAAGAINAAATAADFLAEVRVEAVAALATDTYAEPTGAPAATAALSAKIGYLYMSLRNKMDITASARSFYDDAGNVEWSKGLSDNGTTYSEAEGA